MGTMSNIFKRQSLSDEAISRFVDPRTGMRLRPLGVVGGRTVWPMLGASPDDPSNEDEDKETEDEEDGPEGDDSSEGGDGSDKGDPNAKITALEEEKNRQYKRRKEAEAEKARLEKELEELKNKDKDETTRQGERLVQLESENQELKDTLKQTRLENAFLTDNTYSWHNPRRALQVADLSEVEIDSDGTVSGLSEALKALAKSDPYLLKTEKDKDEDEPPSTGGPKNPAKGKKKADADDEAIRNKYPALRR